MISYLEQDFQSELDDPLGAPHDRSDEAELGGRLIAVREPEVHAVEDVEELGAKLHTYLLRDGGGLKKTHIRVEELGTTEGVSADVAEGSPGVRHERRGVEPLPDLFTAWPVLAEASRHARQYVRAVTSNPAKGVVAAAGYVERESALPSDNRVYLPAVQNLGSRAVNVKSREFIDIRELEVVLDVLPGQTAAAPPVERIGRVLVIDGSSPSVVGQDGVA